MSNYYEDTMPLSTNKDEYLKYYIDDSLPMFDKLNIIIKKGQPFQRQALINNLNAYAQDSLFTSLIQFIISDIGTWDTDSIILFPKSLYKVVINNILDNELFNIIFKHMIINVSTGADVTKTEYTFYFNKIIEFFSPTNDGNEINEIKKEFPYNINDDIFELIISLGKFGQSSLNRRLCCYLSSSLCRLIIKDDNNIQDDNSQKLYKRLSYLFCDGEKIIEAQMIRELQYIIPIFKDIMFTNEDIIKGIECYISHDMDHELQCMVIKALINNIVNIMNQKKIVEILILKIKEIIELKEYGVNRKNDIMNTLINSLYINHKLIPKIINKILDYGIIEYYINNFDSLESIIIFIKNFDKIYFLLNTFIENYTNCDDNYELSTNFSYLNNYQAQIPSQLAEIKYNNKINFDELFIKIYNKIYNNFESSESSSSNIYLLEHSDSINNISKENESNTLNDSKKLLFQYLQKIFPCIMIYLKGNKQLTDTIYDLFKKENIKNILNYYCDEKNDSNNNEFFNLMVFLVKNNYKKYISNYNNSNLSYCKEFIYENNFFNKLFLLILNNIYNQFEEFQKNTNNKLCLLIANTLNLLIPKLYKYFKNIVIINNNNTNLNYTINNKDNNNENNKINYLEKNLDEIFKNILSIIISNKNIGDFIKKEYIQIMPYLILYSKNRNNYLKYIKKKIINSKNFFFRKYSINFFEKYFKIFSFDFIYKMNLYKDILLLIKDKINIISTGIIDLIFKYNKKLIVNSPMIFQDLCELLDEIYKININAFNNDINNFDKDKNIIINRILNIRGVDDNKILYTEEDLYATKDNENRLTIIESDIINRENNFEKNKNPKNGIKDGIYNNKSNYDLNGNFLQQIKSTSSSFQVNNNNIVNNTTANEYKYTNNNSNIFSQIPFNPRGNTKKYSLSDKSTSDIIKSLTSKNIINNKHYLPKIKGQKIRKDSNCSNNSNNNNNNIFIIKNNEQMINNYKNGIKDKISSKNKTKLIPCSHNRTPSAKMYQGNFPINNNVNSNFNCEEIINKNNNEKLNNKSISNKNVCISIRPNSKSKTISFKKENTNNNYNNNCIHGNNSNKICINAENNTNNTFLK